LFYPLCIIIPINAKIVPAIAGPRTQYKMNANVAGNAAANANTNIIPTKNPITILIDIPPFV